MKRFLTVLVLLPCFAACSSGGGSTAGALPQPAGATLGSLSDPQVTNEAQAQAVRYAQYVSNPADLLYVGNVGNNSITVYHHDASGNAAPLRVIAGLNTGIDAPGQLAEDAQGNLYVANGAYPGVGKGSANPAILVFAHGANGNVAPIRKLAGPATGIHNVAAMTVDQVTGKIFVDDFRFQTDGYLVDVNLLRFPPNAGGNTPPFARSAPGLFPAIELASDSTGHNIIESHSTNEPNNSGDGVDTLAKQFPNNAATGGPGYGINSFAAAGLADDPATKTYLVANGPSGIYRLAENTVGNGNLEGHPERLTPSTVSILSSPNCGRQIAVGYLRNIYTTCANNAVNVYAHDAKGNVPPLRSLSGAATQLNNPYGIYEGQ